jgi:hypothetical protein
VRSAIKTMAALLVGLLCSVGYSQDPLAGAVQRLSNTGVFAFGGVGFIGKISQGEIDFRAIQSQPPQVALRSFELVFATGDAAGRSYALAGIRQLDAVHSKELLRSLDSSNEKVMTMQGCVMESHRLADIVKAIDSGRYDDRLKPAH